MDTYTQNLLIDILVPLIVAVFASGGFWGYIQRRAEMQSASTKLSLGLAHTEIVRQGIMFIERGYITKDEYEDFVKYLYKPYTSFGGNGLAEKIFREVTDLPLSRTEK